MPEGQTAASDAVDWAWEDWSLVIGHWSASLPDAATRLSTSVARRRGEEQPAGVDNTGTPATMLAAMRV